MPHRAEIIAITPLTHNVRAYRLQRPKGYTFAAGQATEAALDIEGWRDKKRPFTFTGLARDADLEFTIKSYNDHEGVTHRLGQMQVGNALLLDDAWETLPYKGPGCFIAGGAGITPFLAILRQLQLEGGLAGNRLIFSNSTARDIILRDELEAMAGLEVVLTVTDDDAPGVLHQRIDKDFLKTHAGDPGQNFYLCGPDPMTRALQEALVGLGADTDRVFIAD